MGNKMIYFFGGGNAEGSASMRDLLGGKGANLAEMTSIGIPVPPGFTITTEVCRQYHENGNAFPPGLNEELTVNIEKLQLTMGSCFGDPDSPLLVSVRSGAARSMPGMMDTVLNLGINPAVVEGLIRKTGDRRFALDVYRRFIQMFGDVVMGVPHHEFEKVLDEAKEAKHVTLDTGLDADDLADVVDRYITLYERYTGETFPTDPRTQLNKSIEAVFRSWDNPRAIKYRQLNDIKGLIGTAVNVQTMVFGNLGETSGTGVAFTRDPATGINDFYGEYLMNAQGEDVVAGIRTPHPIATLADAHPGIYAELMNIRETLEKHYTDMQDLEFTIQEGKLYILQTRTGKRTIFSWIRTQVEMVEEGLIDERTAVDRVPAAELGKLFAPILDPEDIRKKGLKPVTIGLNASPGGACGKVVFTAEDAEAWAAKGEKVILVRIETSPEDIGGMHASQGILTSRGGMTSHAAVVARGMGCPCVSGAGELKINYAKQHVECNGRIARQGDIIAIDGFTGCVFFDPVTVKPSEIVQVLRHELDPEKSKLYHDYSTFMQFVDSIRTLKVRTNADTPTDAAIAVRFGAEGIGLCRTEHMFFESNRIIAFRRLILVAEKVKQLRTRLENASGSAREELIRELKSPLAQYTQALTELLPLQRSDFVGIFQALNGLPATIRTLDPPLHEFLPQDLDGQKEMAATMGVSIEQIQATISSLHEFNPMLGHRGCRLGISYPEVTAMQVRAIIEAALEVHSQGIPVNPEIMIPLVGTRKELQLQRDITEREINHILNEKQLTSLPFHVAIGTMIEVPRAALTADEIAHSADFFSFGTNDLTQMTCGFSRDDAGKFLGEYVSSTIYEYDPFQVLDQTGVGQLVRMAVEKGRSVKPKLKLGICGEHGGEPKSVEFCHSIGLDYVSCSPYRVPIARLAAAQAVIKMES
ncbi:pyruvate, phosphate dikinase [bacterium]|nr:pyruvate, phosphate dikinase [candidate division CSSED10-310 bacterium]